MDEDELSWAGVTDSHGPPEVVTALAMNETSEDGTDVENEMVCVRGVVEPGEIAGGVQDAMLGVTVGGAVPLAKMLPERLKVLTGPLPMA